MCTTFAHLPFLVGFFYASDMLQLLSFDVKIAKLAGVFTMWNIFWPIPNSWYQCMRFYLQAQDNTKPASMLNNLFFHFCERHTIIGFLSLEDPFLSSTTTLSFYWVGLGFVGSALSFVHFPHTSNHSLFFFTPFGTKRYHEDLPGMDGIYTRAKKNSMSM